jgi:hypothetical protein
LHRGTAESFERVACLATAKAIFCKDLIEVAARYLPAYDSLVFVEGQPELIRCLLVTGASHSISEPIYLATSPRLIFVASLHASTLFHTFSATFGQPLDHIHCHPVYTDKTNL